MDLVTQIPPEIWELIFSYLTFSDRGRIFGVCKKLQPLVWKNVHYLELDKICKNFGLSTLYKLVEYIGPQNIYSLSSRDSYVYPKIPLSFLEKLPNLKELDIPLSSVEFFDQDFPFTNFTRLRVLDLRGYNRTVPELSMFTHLYGLRLNDCSSDYGMVITSFTNLTLLDMSDNVSNTLMRSLSRFVNLQYLSLYFGGYKIEASDFASLAKCKCLTYLNCYFCPTLSDPEVVSISQLTRLRFAEFGHCRFSSQSLNVLITTLSSLRHLGTPLLVEDESIFLLTRLKLHSLNMWSAERLTSNAFKSVSLLTTLTSLSVVSSRSITKDVVLSLTSLTSLQHLVLADSNQELHYLQQLTTLGLTKLKKIIV